MSQEFDLIAELREDQGKGASRRLRREGKVPAIIYGAGRPPRMLAFDHNRVTQALESESFYSSVLTIKVGDKAQAAIVKDIQRHPSRRQVLHMDFQRIVADEKIRIHVPIHFLNEDVAVGVKQGGGAVSHLMTDVEITCLPKDLPEYLEVDVARLDLNEMVHLSEIPLPPGVEIPELAQGPEHDHAVVSIHATRARAEAEVEAEAGAVEAKEAPAEETSSEDEGGSEES